MKINVGRVDKSIRITLGIFIITLGIFFQSWWGLVGIIPLFTIFSVLQLVIQKKTISGERNAK